MGLYAPQRALQSPKGRLGLSLLMLITSQVSFYVKFIRRLRTLEVVVCALSKYMFRRYIFCYVKLSPVGMKV